jgi:hypothetical protein
MPLYTFKCGSCGSTVSEFRKINERNHLPLCAFGHSALPMPRIIEAPAVQADLPGYTSPIDGRWIEGRRARAEDLKRNGCRPWEGMEAEKKEAERRANEIDHTHERAVEAAVADVYNGMSAESQRALQQL